MFLVDSVPHIGDTLVAETGELGGSSLFIAFLILAALMPVPAFSQSPPPKIVIIDSYHNGYDWSDEELSGVKERLAQRFPAVDPSVEYLDTKRFSDRGHLEMAAEYLKKKYQGAKIDLVIALDNPAFDLLRERLDLFTGVPVVFAGYNGFTPKVMDSRPKATGLAEANDTEGTIRLALSLFPETREVFVVDDTTSTGLTATLNTQAVAARFEDRVSFVYAPSLSYAELAQRIAELPADTIVLLGAYATDRNGLILPTAESTALLTEKAMVPVFAVVATRLGYGITGGSLISGREHGKTAGSVALRVLDGEDPSWISVEQENAARPMFDYTKLEQFKISMSSLPPGSVVINRPESIIEKYQAQVLSALGVFAVLFALVVVLSATVVKRRLAERELAKSRNRVRAIIDASGDMIIAVDIQRIITDCSPCIEQLFGYAPQEVIGRPVEILHLSPERYRRFMEIALPEVEANGFWRGEWECRRKNGQTIATEATLSAIKSHNGKIVGYVAVVRDIRERRQVQDTLRRAEEKLRQALKMEAIGRLAGGVAHDFNNLLTIIKGYGDMVLEKAGADSELASSMKEIVTAAEQASLLTGRLLAFSRKQVFQPKVFDLNILVSDLTRMLARMIGEDIKLSTSLAAKAMYINADPSQIEQAIMNLSLNARDAMPRGGTLSISTEEADPPASYGRENQVPFVALTVRDTGCGMDNETLSHLFEPFYSTKERGHGTGLGLSTVYGIVKQSEGHITCNSAEGKGTTFTLFLPLHDGAPTTSEKEEVLKGTESILLVEDEEAVRKFVKSTLSSRGFSVLDTSGGSDALRLISNGEAWADLVITDVIMPGMSGRQLAEQIRRFLPRTKILFISGYTGGAVDAHNGEPDVSPLLQKPFGPEELVRKVRSILDGE